MTSKLSILILLACVFSSNKAFSEEPAWKYFATSTEGGHLSGCFFDATSIASKGKEKINVWMKCLPMDLMNKSEEITARSSDILFASMEKAAAGYVPPYSKIKKLSAEQITSIIWREESANIAGIAEGIRILADIDCHEGIWRSLSTLTYSDGGNDFLDKPSRWLRIVPESNIHNLSRLTCPD